MEQKLLNAQLYKLFPTPIIVGHVPDISICDRLEALVKKEEQEQRGISEEGVFTTDDLLHVEGRGFDELVSLVLGESNQFMDWIKLTRTGHKINGMWANVTKKHHRHPTHIHPNSYISGVIYVKTPEGCGNIVFSDPRAGARVFEPDYDVMNEFNSGTYSHKPEKGTMILFPSWMPHCVEKGTTVSEGEERIVIAFNVQMIGSVNRRTSRMDFC